MISDATDRVRRDWQDQASHWYHAREELLSASRPIHDWLIEHLDPCDGERVLEIAAGPGDTGFLAARRLGSGRLLSTDLAPAMVDAARKRGAELGVDNAEFRTLDAQAMDLPDASFDAVICRWGLMLMPDPAAALRECRRVLEPGGRLAFAVFTGPEENQFASLPGRVLMEAGHLPRPVEGTWQPGILALADLGRLRTLIADAGFALERIDAVEMTWRFPHADAYWSFLVDLTAFGPLVRSLSDAARVSVRSAMDARLASFTDGQGIVLPSRCWCGVAVR